MNDTYTNGLIFGPCDIPKTGGSIQVFEYIPVKRSFLEWISYYLFWAEKPPQKFIGKGIDIESIKHEAVENGPFGKVKFIIYSDAMELV